MIRLSLQLHYVRRQLPLSLYNRAPRGPLPLPALVVGTSIRVVCDLCQAFEDGAFVCWVCMPGVHPHRICARCLVEGSILCHRVHLT